MKNITLILAAAFLAAAPSYAKCGGKSSCNNKSKCGNMSSVRKAQREKEREAIKAFMEPKDSNNDGSLTLEEFVANESDRAAAEKAFEKANKNGDRYLQKSEIKSLITVASTKGKGKKKCR